MSYFYVEVVNKEIADCLVKIAQKNKEEKPSERDEEISEDGLTWTINGQEIAFCEISRIYHKMRHKIAERK